MKRLFTEKHAYTWEAHDFCNRLEEAMKPIVDAFVANGYDPRDMQNIIIHAAFDLGVQVALNARDGNMR